MPNWRFTSIVPETDKSVVAVVSDGDHSRRYRITKAQVTSTPWPLRAQRRLRITTTLANSTSSTAPGRPGDSPQHPLIALHVTPLDLATPPLLTARAIRVTRVWQLMLSLSAVVCILGPFVYGFARARYAWPIALLCTVAVAAPIRGRTLPGWIGWLTDQIGSRDPAAHLQPVDEALAAGRR